MRSDRPGARQRSRASAARDTIAVGRDGRLSGPELSAALARRHPRRRRRRDRRRHGRHADDVLRRAASRHAVRRHGDRQPQPAGLQRPQDGDRRRRRCPATTSRRCATRIERGDFAQRQRARSRTQDIAPAYLDRITGDVQLARPMKHRRRLRQRRRRRVRARALPRASAATSIELFCDVDGNFPNHHPDPSQPENLAGPDRGGCAQRRLPSSASRSTATATGSASSRTAGNIIYPDRQLMLFAADVLTRAPGATIIYDVKSHAQPRSRGSAQHGGVPLMWKTGHSLIKAKMKEVGARARRRDERPHRSSASAGTASTTASTPARGCSRSCRAHADPSAVLDALPDALSTPELNIACAEGEQHALIAQAAGDARISRRRRRHPHRRPARRISGRLRSRARVEHDAGDRAALRGRRRRRRSRASSASSAACSPPRSRGVALPFA